MTGAPGVGKTSTVECIAELVAKPLYPITSGDLGSSAEAVEKNLKKHFTLANKWNCIMLLDEADAFLAKRKQYDLQRNSIVAVFLRMLDYFQGILFLTTNRMVEFDEAFKSRIHISLFCKYNQGCASPNRTLN
jgi:AAA+ superfamily predicted ATPase